MKKITLLKSGFRLFVIILSLCSIVFLQSCKDATLEPEKVEINKTDPSQEVGSVVLKDNRLVFSSGKFVDKYLSDLKKSQPDGMNPIYNVNIKGFKSMQEKYDELMKYGLEEAIKDGTIENYKDALEITTDEKGRKDYKIIVRNHLLASIISEKGLIQMGNDVYKIKDGKAYKTDEKNIQGLSSIGSNESNKISVIEFATTFKSDKSAKVNGPVGKENSKEYSAFSGAATRRFCTRIDIYKGFWSPSTIYGEFSVRHQRDNWYGWGSLSAGPWTFNSGGSSTIRYAGPFDGNNGTLNFPTINLNPQSTDYIYNNRFSEPFLWLADEVTYRSVNIYGSWTATGNGGQPLSDSYNETATW